jgi:entericidin B
LSLRNAGHGGSFAVSFTFRETNMRSLLVLAVAFAALSVAGCNTIAGMGQDTTAAGHAVTNTANDAK